MEQNVNHVSPNPPRSASQDPKGKYFCHTMHILCSISECHNQASKDSPGCLKPPRVLSSSKPTPHRDVRRNTLPDPMTRCLRFRMNAKYVLGDAGSGRVLGPLPKRGRILGRMGSTSASLGEEEASGGKGRV